MLDRQGPKGCPRQSILWALIATARAGTHETQPTVRVVNGGGSHVFAYTSFDYPARVRETIVPTTTELYCRWSYLGKIRVPRNDSRFWKEVLLANSRCLLLKCRKDFAWPPSLPARRSDNSHRALSGHQFVWRRRKILS